MTMWIVEMLVHDRVEVEADTQEEAEALALAQFDGTANDPWVSQSYEAEYDDENE
jgi:hypothetical protein